jgi:hypothetical protein
MTATDHPGVGASVPTPSMGDVLRLAAYVADLIGNDRVHGVTVYSTRHLNVELPDPFHAATLAGLLNLDGPTDLPAMTTDGETGPGAHSYWDGHVQGVGVTVNTALRPGALPARCPRHWPTTADDVRTAA